MEEYLCLVVVAKNATTDFSSNSPSSSTFFTCREIVDLLRWNSSAIWSSESQTVSFYSFTSICESPSGV